MAQLLHDRLNARGRFLQLSLSWPQPDPANQILGEDGRPFTAQQQPYIHRQTMLGILAQEHGKGIEFTDEVSRLIWSGTENWREASHLHNAASKCELNRADMDKQIQQ